MKKKASKKSNKNKISKMDNLLYKIQSFYDSKVKYIDKTLNLKSEYKILFDKLGNDRIIKLVDNNTNDLLLVGNYSFYGIYQKKTNLWIWASSIPGVKKEMIDQVNKIKAMNYLFENNDDPTISFYYQLLTQDVLLVNPEDLQLINDLLIYLSDDIMVFNPVNKEANTQFITLRNIKERYV